MLNSETASAEVIQTKHVATLPNKGRQVGKAFRIFLLATYPLVMWFDYALFEYWPSLIGFTFVWAIMFLIWRYLPYWPIEVRIRSDRLDAAYRKGTKTIGYDEIARIDWKSDLISGAITFRTEDSETIILSGVDLTLMKGVLDAVRGARPDLWSGLPQWGLNSSRRGSVSDSSHRDGQSLSEESRDYYSYDHFFWGRRAKRGTTVAERPVNRAHEQHEGDAESVEHGLKESEIGGKR